MNKRTREQKKENRTIVFGIIAIIVVCLVFAFVAKNEREYSMNGVIVEEESNCVFVVEDTTGNLWAFESEEGFCVNDDVVISFNDNCTNSNRIDDIIINVKKS